MMIVTTNQECVSTFLELELPYVARRQNLLFYRMYVPVYCTLLILHIYRRTRSIRSYETKREPDDKRRPFFGSIQIQHNVGAFLDERALIAILSITTK